MPDPAVDRSSERASPRSDVVVAPTAAQTPPVNRLAAYVTSMRPATRIWIFNALLLLIAAAVAIAFDRGPTAYSDLHVPSWAILVLVAVLRQLTMPFYVRGGILTFTATEIGLIVALFAVPAWQGIPVYASLALLEAILRHGFHRDPVPWFKDTFNTANNALAAAVAYAIFHLVAGGVAADPNSALTFRSALGALAATVPDALTGYVTITAIALHAGSMVPIRDRQGALFSMVPTVMSGSIGLIAVAVMRSYPYLLVVIGVQTLCVIFLLRSTAYARNRDGQLRELQAIAQDLLTAPDLAASTAMLLARSRVTFRAGLVRLTVLPADSGARGARSWQRPQSMELMREWTADAETLEIVDLVVAAGGAAVYPGSLARLRERAASEGVNTMLVSVIGSGSSLALFEIVGREDTALAFTDNDLELLRTLTTQVTVVVENSRLEGAMAELAGRSDDLHHRAFHDPLTELANRSLFDDRLRHALLRIERTHRPLAVLYIDLDDFKAVNDNHGHAAGDAVLVEVAARISAVLRREDSAARLGGDEFVALLEDVDNVSDVDAVAARILESVSMPIDAGGVSVTCHASIGAAVGGAGSAADELVARADLAMYAAKRAGKGRSVIAEVATG